MALDNEKIIGEGLTYDDVLLVPSYSNVLPRETSLKTKFSRHIDLNIPVVSAGMDTVTESRMAIAIAQEGGIGVLHKNMTIGKQAAAVRKVKRAENGMISDPVTIHVDATVKDALDLMSEYRIGGIPVVDSNNVLVGIVTNRDSGSEKGAAFWGPIGGHDGGQFPISFHATKIRLFPELCKHFRLFFHSKPKKINGSFCGG